MINKLFKLINIERKKPLKNKNPVINFVTAKSTLIGRKKIQSLKKFGRSKREK